MSVTHSGPPLALGKCGINLLWGSVKKGAVLAASPCAFWQGLHPVSFSYLLCEVTGPTFVGHIRAEMTGAESLHCVGAQQTPASPANWNQITETLASWVIAQLESFR